MSDPPAYEFIDNPQVLVRRFYAFVFGPSVPEEARDRLQTIPGSPADQVEQGAEILYAHYDLLGPEGKVVMAQMGAYGASQQWLAFNRDGRWDKIVLMVRRDLGEEVEALGPADAPEPQLHRRDGGVDWRPAPDQPPTGGD